MAPQKKDCLICEEEFKTTIKNCPFCSKCRMNKDLVISKSKAKIDYLMLDEDFNDLTYAQISYQGNIGYIYSLQDVIDYAQIYHPEYTQLHMKRENQKQNKKDKAIMRKEEFDNLLKDHSLILSQYSDLKDAIKDYKTNGKIQGFSKLSTFVTYLEKVSENLRTVVKYRNTDIESYVDLDKMVLNKSMDKSKIKKLLNEILKRIDEVNKINYSNMYAKYFVHSYILTGSLIEDTPYGIFEYDSIQVYMNNILLRHRYISKKIPNYNHDICHLYVKYGLDVVKDEYPDIFKKKDIINYQKTI